jgi:hypothetical protein
LGAAGTGSGAAIADVRQINVADAVSPAASAQNVRFGIE